MEENFSEWNNGSEVNFSVPHTTGSSEASQLQARGKRNRWKFESSMRSFIDCDREYDLLLSFNCVD